jgi:hypothetical protein
MSKPGLGSLTIVLASALACGCSSSNTQAGGSGGSGTGGASGAGGGAATGGTGGGGGGGVGGTPVDAGSDAHLNPAFVTQTLAIASDYLGWGRVDDELRWAPFLCRQPLPGITRLSESNDATTHGQKLYSVFAKFHDAYPDGPQDGQAVVKQSWTAEPVSGADAAFTPQSYRSPPDAGDHFYPYAKADGGVYRAAAPAGLFIMFRLDPSTADTDEGWVYATVSPAGEVTSAGQVASCMGCHEAATHERLFGVPLSPSL